MTQIKKKKRVFKNSTPGQSRDYETLSARRMFQAYEDAPANHTGPAIANWDPPLGKPAKVMYKKKKRELDMETFNANKVDGRTRPYREAVRRIKERQERMKERQSNDNNTVNNIALQAANPFGKEVDEIHSPKDRTSTDAAIAAWTKAGGKTTKLKSGQPKGMDKRRKKLLKKEEVEMKNKYLKIKPGSIEDAALSSLLTAAGENPNDYRPTLHLPEKKYLHTKEGSIERAVEEALTEKNTKPYKLPRQLKDPKKEKMVGVKGKGTVVVDRKDPKYKKHPEHESHDVENMIQFGKPFTVGESDDRRTVDAIRAYDKSKDASRDADWDTVHGKIKQGKKEKKYAKKERGEIDKDDPNWKHRSYHTGMHGEAAGAKELEARNAAKSDKKRQGAPSLKHKVWPASASEEVEIDELSKKTMGSYVKKAATSKSDAAMALQRSTSKPGGQTRKDVDTHVGKMIKRDKGISKAVDKLSKEETEMSPLIQATMEKIHFMRDDKLSYKERQKLPTGDFALPGKGSGPEGKQGGSYPIPDESHARNALARVSQHGSEAEKAKVRRAVAAKYPNIKIGESKAAEEGERDVGTDAYANYAAGLTPGQAPDAGIKSKDAKKASSESKKGSDERERQSTRIDDEYVPTLEEYATHLESLEGEALDAELETLSQNELLELLGTGLVKKAVGAVTKRFSAQGRLKAAKAKGAKIQAKTDLAKQKTSNIAAKAKMKAARAARDKQRKAAKQASRERPQPVAAEYDPEIK